MGTTNRSKNQDFITIKNKNNRDFTMTDFTITTSRRRKTDFITKTVSTTTTMSKITKRKNANQNRRKADVDKRLGEIFTLKFFFLKKFIVCYNKFITRMTKK